MLFDSKTQVAIAYSRCHAIHVYTFECKLTHIRNGLQTLSRQYYIILTV